MAKSSAVQTIPHFPGPRFHLRSIACLITIAAVLLAVCATRRESLTAHAGFRVDNGPPGTLYILSVGLNTLPNGSDLPNLRFAAADAMSVAEAFSTKQVKGAFAGVSTVALINSDATLDRVRAAFERLMRVCQPNDVVIFYFAGFGITAQKDSKGQPSRNSDSAFQFLLADSQMRGTDTSTLRNALAARELSLLLLSIQAQRQIVILDTSESAHAFSALSRALNSDSVFTLGDAGKHFALFGVDGQSQESPVLGHGLMTYTLLEAMKQTQAPGSKGFISEADLEGYMMSHMGNLQIRDRGKTYNFSEQLLSYSDLRGLCLAVKEDSPNDSCNSDYGFDPRIKPKAMRGPQLEEAPAEQEAAARGTDYALILADDKYDHWPALHNPIYDAQTLMKLLVQDYGYSKENIFYRESATKRDVHDVLSDLTRRNFGNNDRLLIYVAGHGFMDDFGQGFIVTRETLLPAEDPDFQSGLNLSGFRDVIDGLPVRHILLVLDVCYGGTFKERKAVPAYTAANLDTPPQLNALIENKMKSTSRIYIASGGLRQAYDGEPGLHSPFARTFLKTLEQFGSREHIVDAGVLDGAVYGLCPHPYFGTFGIHQENGDFVFVPNPDANPVADPGLDAKVEGPHCSF